MRRVHVFISGKVQGVWFRSSTKRIAEQLGLNGWVKNLPDGRVEAVFEGDPEKIERAIEWCRIGPLNARVEKVDIFYEKPEGLNRFEIRY